MNTTTIFTFTDGFFRRYLHYHSVGNLFTNEITDENALSVTFLSVIFCSLISPLVIKKNIITDGKNAQKKNYPLHSVGIFLGKIPYVILSVII
jgi:hypothetical protein